MRRRCAWLRVAVGPLPDVALACAALAPPGRRLSSGSTTKGSGSMSILIFSMASAAGQFVDGRDGQDRLALIDGAHW